MANETLHCQSGNHPWSRVSARGRKPADCPEHRTGVKPAESKPKPTETAYPTSGEGNEPEPLSPAVKGAALAERVYLRMQSLIELDRNRRNKPRP